jgi:hypothetical protein
MSARLLLVASIAITLGSLWLFKFSSVYNTLYIAVGSPAHPSTLLRVAIPALSFLFGGIGAFAAVAVGRNVRHSGSVFVFVSVSFIVVVSALLGGKELVVAQLRSHGFWAFIIGDVVSTYVGTKVWTETQQGTASDVQNARA